MNVADDKKRLMEEHTVSHYRKSSATSPPTNTTLDIISVTKLKSTFFQQIARKTEHTKIIMREIVHIQLGQCGNGIGSKVNSEKLKTEENGNVDNTYTNESLSEVLGNNLRRAWNRSEWKLSRRVRSPVAARQRLLCGSSRSVRTLGTVFNK